MPLYIILAWNSVRPFKLQVLLKLRGISFIIYLMPIPPLTILFFLLQFLLLMLGDLDLPHS